MLYATAVFHHPKHDIKVIPLNLMEVGSYCTQHTTFEYEPYIVFQPIVYKERGGH